jgi:hypothetical protein
MNTDHLTDMEIQQYSFDKENCGRSIINHIEFCDSCKAKAAAYQVISAEIKNIQSPVFDFNLAGLVLSRIPQRESKFSFAVVLVYFIVFVSVTLICITFFLLHEYITNFFNDISPSFFYLVIISAITLVVCRGIEMYRNFQNKMTRLNYY